MGQLRKRDADMLLATRDMEKSRAEAVEREERRLRRMHVLGADRGGGDNKAGADRGPRRDGATRLIESRIVLELQSARGIRSAYGSIGT